MTTKCDNCIRPATGTVYSMGGKVGDYCDTHGRYMLDSGQGDDAHDIEPDEDSHEEDPALYSGGDNVPDQR